MTRPIHLLVLVGLVAFVVGFADAGKAWAQQPPPVGVRFYFFKNGAFWDDPFVGYICRGKREEGKEKIVKGTEMLRVYGELYDKVVVEQNSGYADPAVFDLKYKETRIQFITRPAPNDYVEFECVSSKNGEVTNPFTITITTLNGTVLEPIVTPGAVAFVLERDA